MDGEEIFGFIIMCSVCFGCAILFTGIGIWAEKRKDPMHFYSGTTIDPATIMDIPAYNRENSKLWKTYAMPYWLSGILELLSILYSPLSFASLILMVSASTLGIGWLLWRYKKICNTYMIG